MKISCAVKLRIGVSGLRANTKSVRCMMKKIRSEGATPVFLNNCPARMTMLLVEKDFARIDALVILGNDLDIDPKCYIGRYEKSDPKCSVHPKTKSEHHYPKSKKRAGYEEAMIKKALKFGMPLLGICGGMQRINILCGGTLHQHIPDLVGDDKHMQHKRGISPHIPVVPIIIKPQTMLAAIASTIKMSFAQGHTADAPKVIMENSMHHQAIDRIAPGLRVCAVTDTILMQDGTKGYMAEAIEAEPGGPYAKQWLLGVQWHPEFGASSLGSHITRHLITSARDYTQLRPSRSQAKKPPAKLAIRIIHIYVSLD